MGRGGGGGSFFTGTLVSPLSHELVVSANEIKAKMQCISTLSNLIAKLSLHTMCDKCLMCCKRFAHSYALATSACVGDSSQSKFNS